MQPDDSGAVGRDRQQPQRCDDLGIEKLWEFMGDSDFSIDLIAQLILMAVRRAESIGITVEELISFLRAATGSSKSP